jgi:transmembrane sensor
MTEFDDVNASDEALERESFAWLNRLLAGPLTSADAEALTAWRARSPAHEQRFADAVRFQRQVRRAALAEQAATAAPVAAPRPRRAGPSRRALMGGALAASFAGGYLALRPFFDWPSMSALMSDYHTGVGERRSLAPAPGVAVELNTLTSVDLRPTDAGPGLRLISGEAQVAARRAAAPPFSVRAGVGQVLLAQARVNVRQLNGSVCVTCLDGRAEIDHPEGRLQLAAGSQVVYTAHAIGKAAAADLAVVAGWRDGLLIFRDAPLQHVVDELNRYRKGRIVLLDAALAKRPVYGVFQLDQIGRSVAQIQKLTGARATALPGDIVVLS